MAGDYFQLLELPRMPWLEESIVRDHFQRKAASSHPDVAGGSDAGFSELNEAWRVLRSPSLRLRHYLELTDPEALRSAGTSAPVFPDLFMDIADAQRTAIAYSVRANAASSPLTRAVHAPEGIAVRKRLEELSREVSDRMVDVHRNVQAATGSPPRLAQSLHELIFLEKWAAQLRESLSTVG